MSEQLDLSTPTPSKPGRASYAVDDLDLNWGGERIDIWLLADNGERQQFVYKGVEAMTLMRSVNKSNNSVKSLHRRVIEKLIADGKLSGTISGVPD